jgi:Tfp pilus assembly protein PilO
MVVLIVLFSIIFVLFVYLAIRQAAHINALSSEISAVQREISQRRTLIAQLKELKTNEQFLRKQHDEISTLIPKQPYEGMVLMNLQKSADDCGIPMVMIRFEKRSEEGELVSMPLDISFSGSYPEFKDLLSEIMYGSRLIRINELDLRVNDGMLEVDILANAFYSK